MVYVFWREENVTTRRLLAEADGWAGQEVVDASGRHYTIRRCWETGPVGLYGRIGPTERRTVRYETVFEEEVRRCPLPELQAWIAREYPQSEWFREACWRNAADFRQVVYSCRSFEELVRMFRCRPGGGTLHPTRPRALSHCGPRCRSCDWAAGPLHVTEVVKNMKINHLIAFLFLLAAQAAQAPVNPRKSTRLSWHPNRPGCIGMPRW